MFSIIAPAIILGNVPGSFFAAIANRIGQMRPSLSGDGVVMPESSWQTDDSDEETGVALTEETIITGRMISMVMLLFGHLLALLIGQAAISVRGSVLV